MSKNAHVRNVDVKYFWRVQVNAMEATFWAVNNLQSLTIFDGQINCDWPIYEISERLKQS